MTFDDVIVGGGSAGCVLAARLSEDPARRVCLIEAGQATEPLAVRVPLGLAVLARTGQANWAFETEPQPGLGGRRGYQPRGRLLGGSSAINAMIYMRGHPADYDGWAAQGNPDWSWAQVLPCFLRAEHNERGAGPFHGTGGPLNVADLRSPNPFVARFLEAAQQCGHRLNPDFNGADPEGVGAFQVTQRDGERWSAARAYLAPARGRPNLTVLAGAHALRVLFDDAGRACGVVCRDAGGERVVHATREVLLAAGAFGSPQLLMHSGIGPGEHLRSLGIPVRVDQPGVGAGLQDHIDVTLVIDSPGSHDLLGLSLPGLARLAGAVGRWRRERRGLLTSNIGEAGGFIRSDPAEPIPDLQLHFVIGKLIAHGRRALPGHGFSCHVCLLRPRSRGTVRLASADPLAAPRIDPAFLSDDDDLRRLVRGFRLVREILHAPALAAWRGRELYSAQARSDAQIEAFVRAHADTIYHPAGTCRMGPGAHDVVDSRLRVRGVAGLRVVDASVMPTIVGGNTNAPTIMIAERAVDFLRQEARG
jgi:choline dehydrogenase-like flavoprotein